MVPNMSYWNADYNTAKRMDRHANEDERRYMKEDWNRFLYAICHAMRVEINWFGFDHTADKMVNTHSNYLNRIHYLFIYFSVRLTDNI